MLENTPSPIKRLLETKEKLKDQPDIELDDDPRFSLESCPDKKKEPIIISTKEQIRYEENTVFSESIYGELQWLLEQTTIDPEGLERRIKTIEANLTPAQNKTFARITERIKANIENASEISENSIQIVIQKAKELNYLPGNTLPKIEITPYGAIILSINEKDWFPFDRKAAQTEGFRITEVLPQGVENPQLQKLLERTIVIKHTGNKQRNDKIKKHELFHDLYHTTIAPEQPLLYNDPVEKRLFTQIKDEILAYLAEGKWESYLENLSFDTRQKSKAAHKDHYGVFMDMWGIVVRNLQDKDDMTQEEATNKADNFTDQMWLLIREMKRLYYSKASTDQGIKAILTVQDTKEAMYKLRGIGNRSEIDGETLWHVLRHEQKENKYGLDTLYSEQIDNFLHDWKYFQLPDVKNFDKFLALLEEYIESQKNLAGEEKNNRIQDLEEVLVDLKRTDDKPKPTEN